ncbi:MAG: SH3 domain-containing protein [Caldilineaceae bacterium]|nr:SH3 domain-containing protein [Caldilineaceae bacterium]
MKRFLGSGAASVLVFCALLFMSSATSHADGGWYPEYFANRDLAGAPSVVRTDGGIDFNWGNGSPDGLIPADDFSVRWTQTLYFDEGDYEFSVAADDGVRLFVGGTLIIDDWRESSGATRTGTIHLGAGNQTVRLEYFEHTGSASVRLSWARKESSRLIGNIITYAAPGTWVRVYRRMPSGEWQYMTPGGVGPIDASGRIKIDGLPVEAYYGNRGQPYRVELWTQGRMLDSLGDTDNGRPEWLLYPFRDNITSWAGSPVTSTPAPTPTPAYGTGGPVYVYPYTGVLINARYLNVRRGPGVGYGILTTISRQDVVELTGYRNARGTWIEIRAKGVTGWVNAWYIRSDVSVRDMVIAP